MRYFITINKLFAYFNYVNKFENNEETLQNPKTTNSKNKFAVSNTNSDPI